MIKLRCTFCSQKIKVPPEHMGRQIKCPHCKGILTVSDAIIIEDDSEAIGDALKDLLETLPSETPKENEEYSFEEQPTPVPPSSSHPPTPMHYTPSTTPPKRTWGTRGKMMDSDFWSFRRMWTPILIQYNFISCLIILSVICVLFAFWQRVFGEIIESMIIRILIALVAWIFGFVCIRVYFEHAIIFFRMNETLSDIEEKL